MGENILMKHVFLPILTRRRKSKIQLFTINFGQTAPKYPQPLFSRAFQWSAPIFHSLGSKLQKWDTGYTCTKMSTIFFRPFIALLNHFWPFHSVPLAAKLQETWFSPTISCNWASKSRKTKIRLWKGGYPKCAG